MYAVDRYEMFILSMCMVLVSDIYASHLQVFACMEGLCAACKGSSCGIYTAMDAGRVVLSPTGVMSNVAN